MILFISFSQAIQKTLFVWAAKGEFKLHRAATDGAIFEVFKRLNVAAEFAQKSNSKPLFAQLTHLSLVQPSCQLRRTSRSTLPNAALRDASFENFTKPRQKRASCALNTRSPPAKKSLSTPPHPQTRCSPLYISFASHTPFAVSPKIQCLCG
ncbi:MAG TPA: hypothetical protein VGW12_01470 [Pyrinomonadaceae bacterium]|nr:hypothetical protein [Pyrinomonadaceae bacterium]